MLNRSSRGALDRPSRVRSTCSASGDGSPRSSFSNAAGEVRVVLVRVADHQPGGQDHGHRLLLGQLERREEGLLGVDPPHAVLAPDRESELLLEGDQVAIDRAARHPDPGGDVARAHPLRVGLQHRHEAGQPGETVALGRIPSALVVDGHWPGG